MASAEVSHATNRAARRGHGRPRRAVSMPIVARVVDPRIMTIGLVLSRWAISVSHVSEVHGEKGGCPPTTTSPSVDMAA